MNIINSVLVSFRISTATMMNKIIYYFKKIPLIGQAMPDSAYGFGDIKTFVSVLLAAVRFLGLIFWKAIYVMLVAFLPVTVFLSGYPQALQYPGYLNILVFLSFLFGSFRASAALDNTIDRYVTIKLMKMPAKQYMVSHFLLHHVGDLIGFLPVCIVVPVILGRPFWEGILLAFYLVCFHAGGETLRLFLFSKTNPEKELFSRVWMIGVLALISCALAYVPVLMELNFRLDMILFSVWFFLIAVLIGVGSVWYQLRFNGYTKVASRTIRAEDLQEMQTVMAKSRFADVQLKEKDLTKTNAKKFERLSGYRYLNAIFFERHKRMLVRPMLIMIAIVLFLFLAAVCTLYFVPDVALPLAEYIPNILPLCVFLMYLATATNERVCRAMFNNCDIALLRYSYYRQPSVILKNFRIRLFWMMRWNLALSGCVAAALVAFAIMAGISWQWLDLIAFIISILLLGVFFSVHYLFLYYVFQPYTTDLGMKNPFFNLIQGIVYVACLVCLQLDSAPKYFSLIVLAATVCYIVLALLLIQKFAPKNFRVK
jgi:hypothetical protein